MYKGEKKNGCLARENCMAEFLKDEKFCGHFKFGKHCERLQDCGDSAKTYDK